MYCHLKAGEHEGLKTYSTLVEEYTPVEAYGRNQLPVLRTVTTVPNPDLAIPRVSPCRPRWRWPSCSRRIYGALPTLNGLSYNPRWGVSVVEAQPASDGILHHEHPSTTRITTQEKTRTSSEFRARTASLIPLTSPVSKLQSARQRRIMPT